MSDLAHTHDARPSYCSHTAISSCESTYTPEACRRAKAVREKADNVLVAFQRAIIAEAARPTCRSPTIRRLASEQARLTLASV
jgi:hypothetical protein